MKKVYLVMVLLLISNLFFSGAVLSDTIKGGKLDINQASLTQLIKIKGIGKVKAQRIIDYRNDFGPFESLGQLINVKGFGVKSVEKLQNFLTAIPPKKTALPDEKEKGDLTVKE